MHGWYEGGDDWWPNGRDVASIMQVAYLRSAYLCVFRLPEFGDESRGILRLILDSRARSESLVLSICVEQVDLSVRHRCKKQVSRLCRRCVAAEQCNKGFAGWRLSPEAPLPEIQIAPTA